MKYERFEDLPVWKAAADLAVQIFAWSSHAWFRGKGDLANQLQRARCRSPTISPRALNEVRPMSFCSSSISLVVPPEKFDPCCVSSNSWAALPI